MPNNYTVSVSTTIMHNRKSVSRKHRGRLRERETKV